MLALGKKSTSRGHSPRVGLSVVKQQMRDLLFLLQGIFETHCRALEHFLISPKHIKATIDAETDK